MLSDGRHVVLRRRASVPVAHLYPEKVAEQLREVFGPVFADVGDGYRVQAPPAHRVILGYERTRSSARERLPSAL